ncbi:helix-turn-helix transcriptional regulator [Rhizobium bangladeshense]|uniref:Transcriptional regulator with XRE-family HTH domain n=1 Tax=Rhizobium binae TaxID=1138190 RepID=A0ABV2MPF6_9HYPH|nr:helix-turn-helix transcriptional regulator [Rhizobium bangladeshense]MBX4938112.1 helix-turn-helix transcriptional regulator [Rhizobium binae]MBX5177107.1 helix-turn-helix transcriptional regulator [Rhizobium lentis]MBX5253756.1 helix-turn-helix transcriptional regulator [Rhizobium sp. NLR4b]MBX5260000.1 helix-turn-helix transcriptional regulator [Rhizobium sp. NLR16b]MBX5266092.1 helix-turn-helix transcriptional regulator [Rhizobium sp. NLR16a]MBX5272211.1 helix-turn-helix transcriptional
MAYKTEHITQQLRAAREGQKVSQRELSARSGLTQSHISQIERGTMEPGLGSLVDVARALDLEIVLAPKKLMPAIRNILDSSSTSNDVLTSDQRKLVARLERWLAQFGDGAGTRADADIFKDSLALLRHLPLTPDELDMLKRAAERLETSRADKMSRQEMGAIAREIRQLRNAAVHRDRDDAVPRSAYALDEDDDA